MQLMQVLYKEINIQSANSQSLSLSQLCNSPTCTLYTVHITLKLINIWSSHRTSMPTEHCLLNLSVMPCSCFCSSTSFINLWKSCSLLNTKAAYLVAMKLMFLNSFQASLYLYSFPQTEISQHESFSPSVKTETCVYLVSCD